MLVPWCATVGTEVHFGGAGSPFLPMSLHFLLLQGFSATSKMFPPPLIKLSVLQRWKFLLPVATSHLKPPGCPIPLVLMTFSRAAHLQALPDLRTSIRAGSRGRWQLPPNLFSVASLSPPCCVGTRSSAQPHGQHVVLHPICFPSLHEHRLSLSSNPELKEHGFSPLFFSFFSKVNKKLQVSIWPSQLMGCSQTLPCVPANTCGLCFPSKKGKKRTFMSRDSAGVCGKEGVGRGCYFCCCNYLVAKSLTLDVSSGGSV